MHIKAPSIADRDEASAVLCLELEFSVVPITEEDVAVKKKSCLPATVGKRTMVNYQVTNCFLN
jgi:hypothetical protein